MKKWSAFLEAFEVVANDEVVHPLRDVLVEISPVIAEGGFCQCKHPMDVVVQRIDRRFGPEMLVADHRVHDRIEAAARRSVAARVVESPLDKLPVAEAIANHLDSPMLTENKV